jgi:hypothetical protein
VGGCACGVCCEPTQLVTVLRCCLDACAATAERFGLIGAWHGQLRDQCGHSGLMQDLERSETVAVSTRLELVTDEGKIEFHVSISH